MTAWFIAADRQASCGAELAVACRGRSDGKVALVEAGVRQYSRNLAAPASRSHKAAHSAIERSFIRRAAQGGRARKCTVEREPDLDSLAQSGAVINARGWRHAP